MTIAILCFAVTLFLFIYHFRYQKSSGFRPAVTLSLALCVCSVATWYVMNLPNESEVKITKLSKPMTIDEILLEIQGKLRKDKNNPDLWFQLGQGYFANGEYENADTCFDYAIRLTEQPSSTVYAAKATAKYYISSQRVTAEVRALLDKALAKDQLNDTALMLIANDHFISFRYDEAIKVWQKILDSERVGIDRVSIINSINRAKELRH